METNSQTSILHGTLFISLRLVIILIVQRKRSMLGITQTSRFFILLLCIGIIGISLILIPMAPALTPVVIIIGLALVGSGILLAWKKNVRVLSWLTLIILSLGAGLFGWNQWSTPGALLCVPAILVNVLIIQWIWRYMLVVPTNSVLVIRNTQNIRYVKGPAKVQDLNPFTEVIVAHMPLYGMHNFVAVRNVSIQHGDKISSVMHVHYQLRSEHDWAKMFHSAERLNVQSPQKPGDLPRLMLQTTFWSTHMGRIVLIEGSRFLRTWLGQINNIQNILDTTMSKPELRHNEQAEESGTYALLMQRRTLVNQAQEKLDAYLASWGIRVTNVELLVLKYDTEGEDNEGEDNQKMRPEKIEAQCVPYPTPDTTPQTEIPDRSEPYTMQEAISFIEHITPHYRYHLKALELILEHSQMNPRRIHNICQEAATEMIQKQAQAIACHHVETALIRVARLPISNDHSPSYSDATAI